LGGWKKLGETEFCKTFVLTKLNSEGETEFCKTFVLTKLNSENIYLNKTEF
jgi:hypothetical protein